MSQRASTADVTVIGLGRMGAALARALLNGGRSVAVWNRDASKAAALVPAGARACATLDAAVSTSPVIVLCLTGYATWTRLASELPRGALDGKTVVQLSNGAPDEAGVLRDLHTRLGAQSLDGSILGFPSQVGAPDFPITLSGSAAAFTRVAPVLSPLGDLQFVSEEISASSGLEAALVFFTNASHVCYLQSAALLRASGVPLEELSKRVKPAVAMLVSLTRESDRAIAAADHRGTEATLDTFSESFDQLLAFAQRSGASTQLLGAFSGLMKQAIHRGHGHEELSSLYEVLGSDAATR